MGMYILIHSSFLILDVIDCTKLSILWFCQLIMMLCATSDCERNWMANIDLKFPGTMSELMGLYIIHLI